MSAKVTVERALLPKKPKTYIAEVDFGNGNHAIARGPSKHEALISLIEHLLSTGRVEEVRA
jgi:hypothetical protein